MEEIKKVLKILVSVLFIGIFQSTYAVTVDKIVAFGDSLSDNGNVYNLTKDLLVVPIIPMNPPYYEGRFTNGENWLDVLAKETGLPLLVHAYGGAWAEPLWDSKQIIPGIGEQVRRYLWENDQDNHKDQHLFVIWAGGNDYLDGRKDVEYATTNTIKHIKNQIERLINHGAQQFLLATLPDVSKTPEVASRSTSAVLNVKALVDMHNEKLRAMIKEEQEKHPKLIIILVDLKDPFDRLETHPEEYRIKNTKHACYSGYFYLDKEMTMINPNEIAAAKKLNLDIMNNTSLRVAYLTSKLVSRGNNVCRNPDEYIFWDHIHPTRVIHNIIATLAKLELSTHDIQWPDKEQEKEKNVI